MRLVQTIEKLLSETLIYTGECGKVGKKARKTQILPPKLVTYGVSASIIFFICLTVIELMHLIILRAIEPTIVNLMGYIVTFLLGTFFGAKNRG
ncbi:MAG: hypothetical protein ACUVTM_06410 [Candidatus Bathyarchaeia archaeon]